MLTVREPPTTLVIACTVRVGDIPINVNGRELHVILILESIRSISIVSGQLQTEAILPGANPKSVVIRKPSIIVDILHHDPKHRTVIVGKMVQSLVTDPKLSGRSAESISIILPGTIKVDRTVLAPLDGCPLVEALCHQRVMLPGRGNQIKISLATLAAFPQGFHLLDLGAVTWQLVDDGFVLVLDVLQLLHQPGGTLQLGKLG